MATQWSVLVFGDSWADYMHPTWPQVLGRRLSARVFNFAQAGSLCSGLSAQAQAALLHPQVPKGPGGLLRPETLVVVHTAGNDLIMKMAEGVMGSGIGGLLGGMPYGGAGGLGGFGGVTPEILRANPGAREAEVLRLFLDTMYRGGARNFLVSGVPAYIQMPVFNMIWPIITGLVNAGKLEDLGVSPGDPPQLAMEVQAAALHERWADLVERFGKDHPDATCVFFDEVHALERLRVTLGAPTFDRAMWDFTMFHPSQFGHEQLASEAHRCTVMGFPTLAALAPHPEVPRAAEEAAERKAKEEAERKAKEEAERKAKDEAERKAKDEALRRAKEQAEQHSSNASQCPSGETQANGRPMKVHVRNVRGDVSFTVACDATWHAPELRKAVLAAAPPSFAAAGTACVLAMRGKFLGDGPETLAELGVVDDTNLVMVVRAPAAAAAAPTSS